MRTGPSMPAWAAGIVMCLVAGIVEPGALAQSSQDFNGRHSLLRTGAAGPDSMKDASQQSSSPSRLHETNKPDVKRRRLIKKMPGHPESSPVPPSLESPSSPADPPSKTTNALASPGGVDRSAPGIATVSPAAPLGASASMGGARSGSGLSSLSPASAGNSVAGTGPGTPGMTGRSLRSLLQHAPGLSQLMTGIPPPLIPAEPVAPLPPPLNPPPAGLPVLPVNWYAYHVLNRLTYGGTPNQLNMAASLNTETAAREWAAAFMKEQLELDPAKPWPTNLHNTTPLPTPIPIQDIAADLLLSQNKATWRADDSDPGILSPTLSQLQDYDLLRKMHSRRQLKEKLVYFWDNHFNTNYRAHGKGQYELMENEAFRTRAFGTFLDLLMASGKSAAMMIYLNTDVNVKENPNENYAREVLELHTLGVTDQGTPNGYTQFDIVEAAKTFTGWDNTPDARGGFRFVSGRHSPGSKLVLGQSIPFDGSRPTEGEQVLTLAARHPSTARHLAKKLCEYFVSDSPSAALVSEAASVLSDSNGDIKKVLIAIFTSPDFMNPSNYRGQIKTPLEYLVGLYRNLGVWSSRDPFRARLVTVGQSIYDFAPPTGFKEESIEWLNTNVLFHETSMAYETTIAGFGASIKFGSTTSGGAIRLWMEELGLKTEAQILGFLTNLTLDRMVTATEYQIYLSTLRSGLNGGVFDIDNASREEALDRTMATILTNPRYLYQ